MIYYLNFFKAKQFYKNPIKVLFRALLMIFLLTFKISKIIEYNFGSNKIKFKFKPLKKHMGGRGIFLYRENIEPLLNFGYRLIKKDDIIIDGGSNQGIFTLAFAKHVGKKGKVIAVEPFKYCINQISYNSKMNNLSNIHVEKSCLSNKKGSIKIDYSAGIGSASIVRKFGDQLQVVSTIKIDSIKNKYKLNKIDLIKLDIEGAELLALYGAKNVLRKFKPILSIECEEVDFKPISKFLKKYNYLPFLFDNVGKLKRINKIYKKEACLLFIHKSKKKNFY